MLAYLSQFINKLSLNRCLVCDYYINWDRAFCIKCCESLPLYLRQFREEFLFVDEVKCAFTYAFPVDNLISRFKFVNCYSIGWALTTVLYQKIKHSPVKPEALIYVPLHSAKLYRRKFDQAHFIAKILAQRLSIPLLDKHLIKTRATADQHNLDKKQRKVNLKNAFGLCNAIPYNHVAIVDDVITTGATVSEVARILKKYAHVQVVEAWGLARAI